MPRLAVDVDPGPASGVDWDLLPALPPFLLADGSAPAAQATSVRLAWDGAALHVRFDCADRDSWGTYLRRDDPLYEEECVEVFLAAGAVAPAAYLEFEVSPRGTLFDARVENPDGRRNTMRVDSTWDCPGLRWSAGQVTPGGDWWAELAIPWAALQPESPEPPASGGGPGAPSVLRANFYRIERPRHPFEVEPEFSCWSPTLTTPADFHKPARFGRLELAGAARVPRGRAGA